MNTKEKIMMQFCGCNCGSSCSCSGVVLTMALVFTLTHVFTVVTASPEDWPSGPPFGHVEDPGVFTKAFINVTKEEEGEWKSQVDELGRLVHCFSFLYKWEWENEEKAYFGFLAIVFFFFENLKIVSSVFPFYLEYRLLCGIWVAVTAGLFLLYGNFLLITFAFCFYLNCQEK